MYGSQEKKLGQKVNVKFFTVDPYSGGYRSATDFFRIGQNSEKSFLKTKTSTIKSEQNIYQAIHSTSLILIFFGIFTIFCIFPDFQKKNI